MLEIHEDLKKAQRDELEAVLSSQLFARAPGLGQLLRYLCQKTFAGQGDQIKEYNIAVEALGKPPEFDQKKDSIVRVEAHRLRKRLRQYYNEDGASHALQIELPSGSYIPRFVKCGEHLADSLDDTQDSVQELAIVREVTQAPPPPRRRVFPRWLIVATLLTTVAAIWFVLLRIRPEPVPATLAADAIPAELDTLAVRIRAGAPADMVDARGQRWMSDRYFTGGEPRSLLHKVEGTDSPSLYETAREGEFRYDIPLKPGVYELSLHFSEPAEANNSRTFNVQANGSVLLTELDIVTDAGDLHTATVRVFKNITPADDGKLHLEFQRSSNLAILNAISIIPGSRDRLRPVRMVSRAEPYTDINGQVWTEDRYAFGGRYVRRVEAIQGTDDPDLYRGERYGRLTYIIPVPTGSTYTVIFHFAETWFGPQNKGGGGEGSRIFDVFCNGEALLRDFDVFKEAGGERKALRKVFRGLRPSPQGKLVLTAIPSRNYAFVNAIEVLDEGPFAKP